MIKKGELYYPDAAAKKRAWLKQKTFTRLLKKSGEILGGRGQGALLAKTLEKAYVDTPPHISWFAGAKLNISENCLDRNLAKRKNKVAIIWEPDDSTHPAQVLTYYELYRAVNKFANALKKMGVKRGDRVGIYLPMIPEVVVSMLACARIGAVHSVVFSAFSANALRIRLQDAGAKVLITVDGYYRRGKLIDLKRQADEAVSGTAVEK